MGKRNCEFWSPVESVSPFSCFGFDVLADNADTFGFGETSYCCSLSVYSETRALLSLC
jgi:hypothetical protein